MDQWKNTLCKELAYSKHNLIYICHWKKSTKLMKYSDDLNFPEQFTNFSEAHITSTSVMKSKHSMQTEICFLGTLLDLVDARGLFC
jgi:hypothetical protein